MNRPASLRQRWNITREAFDRLLRSLDPDPERAAEHFMSLHGKLTLFFGYNGCTNAEHWADETLDRVAKRLADGQSVPDVNVFARGVARHVLYEAQKEQQRERSKLQDLPQIERPLHDERSLACLEKCLSALSSSNRELICRYYAESDAQIVSKRRQLAEQYGLTIDALRTRALRIRRQLEACVTNCREGGGPASRNVVSSHEE